MAVQPLACPTPRDCAVAAASMKQDLEAACVDVGVEQRRGKKRSSNGGAGTSPSRRRLSSAEGIRKSRAESAAPSGAELRALRALQRVVALESGTSGASAGGHTGDAWREGLQELRAQRAQTLQQQPIEAPPRASAEELLRQINKAMKSEDNLEGGSSDWDAVIQPWRPLKERDMAAVVGSLDTAAAAIVFQVCVRRYCVVHPTRQGPISSWITCLLERKMKALLAFKGVRKSLALLTSHLEARLAAGAPEAEVRACLGKWRFIAEMAASRRAAMAVSRPAPPAAAAHGASGDDSSDDVSNDEPDGAD